MSEKKRTYRQFTPEQKTEIVPFLAYGIIGFVFGLLATIPFLLGWLVWGPTIVGSVYAGYRDIFVGAE